MWKSGDGRSAHALHHRRSNMIKNRKKHPAARKGARHKTAPLRATSMPLVHERVAQVAARTPRATALFWEGKELSYGELDRRSNRLAWFLQQNGVGPEVTVGVALERSFEMIIAVLGVLKSGGAYVPLDPAYPAERLSTMMQDSGIRLLLTQERLVRILPVAPVKMVRLDADWTTIEASVPDKPIRSGAKPGHLAYIIYTSGSTGKPKGVMVEHRSLAAYLSAVAAQFKIRRRDRVLQFASLNFDASAEEIYCTLAAGATLVLRTDAMIGSTAEFLRTCRAWDITVLDLPTAFWHMVTADLAREKLELPSTVRLVVIGGERALPDKMSLWRSMVGDRVALLNGYGPTETTVASTMWKAGKDFPGTSVPIGRPLPGEFAYVVDPSGRQVARGTVGELWLGGSGVARGYLNQPDLTAQKFLPNPFGGKGRIYRTGDLVRQLDNGNLEYVGRADHQVKVRGFRIELGEIETALNGVPGVKQSVVVLREDRPGEGRLVGYVVPENGDLGASSLRQQLRGLLPDYMIPSAFVLLKSLPLTPGGKTDRRALPAPNDGRPESDRPLVAPRTEDEKILAELWCTLLGIPEVGVQDPFLELGGHSLLAAQLIARVREKFQVELNQRAVFDFPTIEAMAAQIGRLRAGAHGSEGPAAHRAPRDRDLPLSFAQEAVSFFLRLHPLNVAYNSQGYLRLRGELNVGALQQGLTELVRRHEIFRTTFHEVDGQAVQRIHPPFEYQLPRKDLSAMPAVEREQAAQQEIRTEICTPFDLTNLPLIRWTLLRMSEREHILIVVEHHFVHDGWSFNLLLSELKDLYAAFASGKPSPLEEPPIQFADFVHWQREWVRSDEARDQIAYWRARLAGAPPLLELPTDHPRPARQGLRGSSFSADFPPDLYEALREFSRSHGTSLFMTMLAAFITTLHRESGMDDFCVGCGVANRRHRETEKVLGMIVNTVAIRSNLKGNPTFLDVLAQVRDTSLAALANQDVPFEKVVEALQPKRSLSYLPIYQVMFGFHDSPLSGREFPGLTTELVETVGNGSAKSDLNVIVIPRHEQHVGQTQGTARHGLTVNWEYSTDLFERSSMERMLAHFRRVLETIVRRPEERIWAVPIVTVEEQKRALSDWNDTHAAYPRESSVPSLFEDQSARSPSSPALICGATVWSYTDLNRTANRIAHRLMRLGVKRGDLVGLYLDRSPEAVAGMLGILKAGAAYLPLDAGLPPERLRLMVEDAGIKTAIVQESLRPGAEWISGKILCLGKGCAEVMDEPSENPSLVLTADDLAYVMYTSGSTGRPKGVEVVHRGIVRLVKGQRYAKLGADEVMFQFAPLSFDASTLEVWGSLLNGGRLAICSLLHPSLQELGAEIRKNGVTTLWLTAALFEQMVESVPDCLAGVTQMLSGGDVLSVPHVRKFVTSSPRSVLINGYGPTENTTFTTCHPVKSEADFGRTVPIGRPVTNTEVYILDRCMQVVPVGVIGELYTGGDGLARGYLGRPDITAEKFVPNPFGPPGSRLYRTGDLCKYRNDGAIEFIGRGDHQVKLRGYRIELGEVEAVLRQCPGVRDALVTIDGTGGEKRLIGYCVPTPGVALRPADLRAAMAKKVPAYMVPSAIAVLDAFPFTPTGKVDRGALPAVALEGSGERAGSAQTSMNPTEKLVAKVWGEILHAERIGPDDNFFDLGGHSLLATQVISRLCKETGIELALGQFFETPTVAGLARVLEEKLLE